MAPSQNDRKIVYRDVKPQSKQKQNKNITCHGHKFLDRKVWAKNTDPHNTEPQTSPDQNAPGEIVWSGPSLIAIWVTFY